jgi:hypothetical protein
MNIIDAVGKWLNDHPYVKGALTVAEGAASGAFIDVLANPNGAFTKAGFRQTILTVGGAVAIALRNYFKTAPRKEWTPLERAEKLEGK